MSDERGELLLGARPLAAYALRDERRWRSLYRRQMRRDLGLFVLGGRLAGYSGIIDRKITAKVNAALSGADGTSNTTA